MKKVLIIGSLPQKENEVLKYKTLVSVCEEYGFEVVSSPLEERGDDAFLEYSDAFKVIESADIVLADVSIESILLGMQLKETDLLGKHLVVIAKNDAVVPSIVEGIPNIAEIILYENIEDAREALVRNFSVID